MAITSTDIQNHTFSIDRKGYDVDEVDVFLERLSTEVDDMNSTISQLEDELDGDKFSGFDAPARERASVDSAEKDKIIVDLKNELEEKKANDNAIAQALIIAQRSAEEIIANANQNADQIRQDAEDEAQRILDKANNEKKRILNEIADLENDRETTRSDYQNILQDFIGDATKKLSDLGGSAADTGKNPRTKPARERSKTQPNHQTPSSQVATYTTPPAKASSVVAPATPKPSRVDKDLSGFGDADDDFEFDDVD